ncbi:BspA family leucine-rich repeat surface protein, partial [Prevotella corporis]|uniref:BspA family leucine-rich repeat surface protein n=1 Tax=Prevotella corporis TaxID=28128 RepID=UPI0023F35DCB
MRNYLLSLLVALLAVTGSLPVAAQEAYAVLTSNKTLTFYYDNLRATRPNYEPIYDMPKPGESPAWVGNDSYSQEYIKHAVFDASFAKYRPTSTNSWFAYCDNLQDIEGIRNLNTEKVTDMSDMFIRCYALKSLDVSNFNTQNVTNMSNMFGYCHALKSLDVSNFNTQNVTDMSWMFDGCWALTSLDLSNFNTQNVIYMSTMFRYCYALKSLDVSNFNTQNVTD